MTSANKPSAVRVVPRTSGGIRAGFSINLGSSRLNPRPIIRTTAPVVRVVRPVGIGVSLYGGGYLSTFPRYRSVRLYTGYPRYVPRTSVYYSNSYYYSPHYVPSVRVYNTIMPPPVVVNRVEVAPPPAQVVVEEVPVDVPLQVKLIDTALREGAEDRRAAARALSQYPGISSVAVLVDVLINDADTAVRVAAAKSLGEIGDPAAYEVLLRSATFELDEEARAAAEEAAGIILEKVGEEEVYVSPKMPPMNTGAEELGQYLEELRFGNAEVRKAAADKLEDYPGTQTVSALVDMLINDAAAAVREEAAKSLAKIGDRMALPFLQWAQQNDPDKSVRDDAERAIEKIYDKII